jgi:hypothetical protein
MVKHSELLQQNPDKFADNNHGALHIPIEDLETCLDAFNWGTQSYHAFIYKDGYASLCVAASIELVLNFRTDDGEMIKRTFVGACNFPLNSLGQIPDWNATAKSMCIKNAASDAGRWLGRGINSEVLPDRTPREKKSTPLAKPDGKIMQQFLKAVEAGDEATITMLANVYDIKTDVHVEEK